VLREFATPVAGGARANDLAARYGGEEFALVLPHTHGPMAERVAERIRAAVAAFEFLADETPTHVTVSAGVATCPTPPGVIQCLDDLVREADRGRPGTGPAPTPAPPLAGSRSLRSRDPPSPQLQRTGIRKPTDAGHPLPRESR
jgi:hypothetical protein